MTEALSSSDVSGLLERTSRTFALAVPLLPERLAHDVGVAYLLFRIADTLEDADLWDRARREAALLSFARFVERGEDDAFLDLAREQAPSANADYTSLVLRAKAVMGSVTEPARAIIGRHLVRTARGMAEFVAAQDDRGAIELVDVPALRRYCYAVAGIVGEMLTELFAAADDATRAVEAELAAEAAAFGEGLQLVNILKDAPDDAREGRVYLPRAVPRSEIMTLARRDLDAARRYVGTLERAGAARGIRAFCTLPVRLADATLDCLARGDKKLAREEAMRIYAHVTAQK